MALHRLTSITIGVPDLAPAIAYYRDFGLRPEEGGWLSTVDGGRQLRLVTTPTRRLVELEIGVDDPDDVARMSRSLRALDLDVAVTEDRLSVQEPVSGVRVVARVGDRLDQPGVPAPPYNAPGDPARGTTRAPAILRETPVRPRKLGHVVIGSVDQPATERFFTQGVGLKVSDVVPGMAAFMRCSTDHHNVLVSQAPVNFLHHTSWQVEDVDEIGRGATEMLREHPERHVWGLGRHHIGSNFFWYLKDPAGNFSEYYSDLDCVVDDALWKPEVWDAAHSLYSWGPPPPPSFIAPDDLAALMAGAHRAP
ncbi:dioxygenase [Sphaerisporangium krabiense]|uniref:Catechol 2,3-dioxygenase-like lactoylglutathione lyase family enzyme n=1 Tax=Sphaerisporangium krabiense TaxID=763782 RepID=A0A7W8ZCJ1_9ACTN|nr:VOC family protein [Sphaerisporangium krabiense]MBB5631544.1 catechol 2,3-dioxygenase-like lactoylglutathione lyase family enzyme [Sphaerisporangium krabiense]GII60958.1 dioxygenase [Sphaerisporangium krabiense]